MNPAKLAYTYNKLGVIAAYRYMLGHAWRTLKRSAARAPITANGMPNPPIAR